MTERMPNLSPEHSATLDRLRQLATENLLRHAIPESAGGLGDTFLDLYRSHRKLGETCRNPGLVLSVNAHLWGSVFPILLYGTDAQKAHYLPALLNGRWLGGQAITEPGGGSDPQAMVTQAVKDGEGFRLTGEKRYITNIPIADWLVVYAKLDERISAFLVSRDDPGCVFTGDGQVQSCRGGTIGGLRLADCAIGPECLLGKPGAGAAMIQRALEFERAFVFAGIAGVMDWQLQTVIRHSRDRRSGPAHLGRHQAISHRIAEMKLRLDTVDLWLKECAQLCDSCERLTLASAQTKLYASEAFLQSSLDAVQILGAAGLEAESGLAELVQDALAGRLFSGSSEVQKNLIAGLLGTGEGFRGRSG